MGVKVGYYAVTDAWTPTECLRQAIEAERMGFDAVWITDHFVPETSSDTQCNFGWTVMSSALQATERVPFITGVTAPIMRYHPAIVAQAFATMGAMYPGRVGLGVGAGEFPNEMALRGGEFPSNATRLEMLEEALTVMNRLWTSAEPVNFAGKHYTLNNAVVLTKPEEEIPLWVSAIGPRAAEVAGRLGDHLISFANMPKYVKEELMPTFEAAAREAGKDPEAMERVGHFAYLYDPDQMLPVEIMQQASAATAGMVSGGALSRAMSSTGIFKLFHSAEDFIKTIEELGQMGYNSVAVANATPNNASWRRVIETARQSSAAPTATLDRLSRATWDEAASLKIWEEVFPHVR